MFNPNRDGFFANFFGPDLGAPGNDRFDKEYSCFPVSFLDRDELEKGNKIILPPSALEALARLNISYPMLFKLSSGAGLQTHAGVLEFVAEEGTCFIPYWMMRMLGVTEGGRLRVQNTTLPKGNFVKLRPVTSAFLEIHNARAVLENTLRNFATLTVGDTVCIKYNNREYEIEVIETRPADAICIIETDVNVDFAPPKDYVEPQPGASASQSFGGASSSAAGATNSATASSSSGAGAVGGGSSSSTSAPGDNSNFQNWLPGNANPAEYTGPVGSDDRTKDGSETVSGSETSASVLFHGSGARLDGKTIKQPRGPLVIQQEEELSDDEPWKTKRVPGGTIRDPPYGYGMGHLTSTGAKKKTESSGPTQAFEGSGVTLE